MNRLTLYCITLSVFLLFFLLIFVPPTYASILVIDKDGKFVWNVLSEESGSSLDIPKHSSIEVRKVANLETSENSMVNLSKNNGKINLTVTSGNEQREIDISQWNGDLVEIEERPEVEKIKIGIKEGKFSLEDKDALALTEYPISVDAKTAELTLGTSSGNRFLSILPHQAVQSALRTRLISKVENNQIEIIEEEGKLVYLLSGKKTFNIFNLFDYSFNVKARVSALTGETLAVDGPRIYKIINFFLI